MTLADLFSSRLMAHYLDSLAGRPKMYSQALALNRKATQPPMNGMPQDVQHDLLILTHKICLPALLDPQWVMPIALKILAMAISKSAAVAQFFARCAMIKN